MKYTGYSLQWSGRVLRHLKSDTLSGKHKYHCFQTKEFGIAKIKVSYLVLTEFSLTSPTIYSEKHYMVPIKIPKASMSSL